MAHGALFPLAPRSELSHTGRQLVLLVWFLLLRKPSLAHRKAWESGSDSGAVPSVTWWQHVSL